MGYCLESCPTGMVSDGKVCVCGKGCSKCRLDVNKKYLCERCSDPNMYLLREAGKCYSKCPKEIKTKSGLVKRLYAQKDVKLKMKVCGFGCGKTLYANEFARSDAD